MRQKGSVARAALGGASLWPAPYGVFFVAFALTRAVKHDAEWLPFSVLLLLHLTTAVVVAVVLVLYIRDVHLGAHLTPEQQTLWTILLLVVAIGSLPAYWWTYVREHRQPQEAESQGL